MASAVTWLARTLLATACGFFLLFAWLLGAPAFYLAGLLLAVGLASSFWWPDMASLSVMVLLGFGLVASAGTWLLHGSESGAIPSIESDIESGVREQTGVTLDVTCPDSVRDLNKTTEGMISCDVMRRDGTTIPITVVLQGAS